jgi:hypothetical protein
MLGICVLTKETELRFPGQVKMFKGRYIGPIYGTATVDSIVPLAPQGVPSFISRGAPYHTGTRDLY